MDIDTQLERDLVISFGKELIQTHDFKDRLKLEWYNRAAALLANRITEMLYDPDELNREVRGKAIWNNVAPMFNQKCDNSYQSLSVFDKINKIHFVPVIHMDYCSLSIKMELDDTVADNVHKISDGLRYDKENTELTAEGSFPGAAIAQFAVAKRVKNGKLCIGDARDVYKVWIQNIYDEWSLLIRGEPVSSAILSAVLERYVLNEKVRI